MRDPKNYQKALRAAASVVRGGSGKALGTAALLALPTAAQAIPGDVNCDEALNVLDIVALVQATLEDEIPAPCTPEFYDYNEDGFDDWSFQQGMVAIFKNNACTSETGCIESCLQPTCEPCDTVDDCDTVGWFNDCTDGICWSGSTQEAQACCDAYWQSGASLECPMPAGCMAWGPAAPPAFDGSVLS